MKTPFRRRVLAALTLALAFWPGLRVAPARAQEPQGGFPAVRRFLTQPAPANSPALTVLVDGLPLDIQVPLPGSVASIRGLLAERDTAADLQAAIDFHAHDRNLGDPNSIGYRLRVAIRGMMDFSTKQNGTARELDARSRKDLAYKAVAITAANRRDAAVTLATWAALELFRSEGGDFSAASLQARVADLTVSVNWRALEEDLRPLLGAVASDPADGPVAGARRYVGQSITFEPGRLNSRTFDPGRDGGGVEVFTWHPTLNQSNRGINALTVRVDLPPAKEGEAAWRTVRSVLPTVAYNPESYAAIDPNGSPQVVLTTLLRVAYVGLDGAQETFRRELENYSKGDRSKFEAWQARAVREASDPGCPVSLRAAGLTYLAARDWADAVRTTLTRTAGTGAVAAAGPVPVELSAVSR